MKQFTGYALALGLSALLLSGCGGASGLLNIPNPRVKFVQAFEDPAAVDVVVTDSNSSKTALANATFGDTSGFLILEDGGVSVLARLAGQNPTVTQGAHQLQVDRDYTWFGYGSQAQATARQLMLRSEKSASSGNVRIRFVHGGIMPAAIDGYITPEIQAMFGGPPVASALAADEGSDYVDFDPGVVNIAVTEAGSQVPIGLIQNRTLEGGKVYSVLLAREAGAYRLLVIDETRF